MISVYSLPNFGTAACPNCGGAVLGREMVTYRPAVNGARIIGERQPANSRVAEVRYGCLSCEALWSAEGFEEAWNEANQPTR